MVGVYYLFLFGANTLTGWIGGWLDGMPPLQFWGVHAGAIIIAGIIFLAVKFTFGRLLASAESDVDAPGIAPGHEAEVTHPV